MFIFGAMLYKAYFNQPSSVGVSLSDKNTNLKSLQTQVAYQVSSHTRYVPPNGINELLHLIKVQSLEHTGRNFLGVGTYLVRNSRANLHIHNNM